jgi:transcription antitermination factor NusG
MRKNDSEARWFVLTVAPQHDLAVEERLAVKGFPTSAPKYSLRRRWSDRVKTIMLPLFPGYVFCRFTPESRVPVMNTPGVHSAISFGGQLAALDDAEVERIHQMVDSGLELEPLRGLNSGMRVKIIDGPLSGLEGMLSQVNGGSRIVVNVELLNRSVAVQVDPDAVAPANPLSVALSA